MRCHQCAALLATAFNIVIAADSPRPRGVGPEFAKYYAAPQAFACISNPSIILGIEKVNDDYCDCPDGSDEPGTSACSYLSDLSPQTPGEIPSDTANKSIALPGFHCKNKGHIPSYVPFQRVNDGVCDHDLCCDGSDEWAQVGGLKCESKCKEIGKEWKKQDEARQRALSAAAKKRKELVMEAARLKKEVEDRIKTLGTQIEGGLLKVQALEKDLAAAEKQERGRVIKGPGKQSKTNVLAGIAKDRVEELRETLLEVKTQRDEHAKNLDELEAILSTFKEEYNPNFNDEGVKRAVRKWEDYTARTAGVAPTENEAFNRDLDEIVKPDSETGLVDWADFEKPDEESDVDVLYKFEAYLPLSIRSWLDAKLRDLRVLLVENGIIAASSETGEESKALTDAREALKAAQDSLAGTRGSLESHQEDLQKDYGADDVFRALKDRCVERDSGEYIYEMCWLSSTTQKPKKGGGNTNMGNFVRFDSVMSDDEVPPNGKGIGLGEKVALRYENGQHCWNGPARSTLVILGCSEVDEIWKVSESEKCVYRMEVGTPAACKMRNASGAVDKEQAKDEL